MKFKKLRNKSEKKILRDKIGDLHRKVLMKNRKNYDTCEICGRSPVRLGRFHILPIGTYPKLEFCDENILLTCWMPCHFNWHHDNEKGNAIREIIKQKLGEDIFDRLKAHDAIHERISTHYLSMVKMALEQELEL